MSQATGAEYLVEPNPIKRRKMGIDLDLLNDSGIPMDGVELDSSTTTNREGSSSTTSNERANLSTLTSSSSNNNLNSSTNESTNRVASSTTNPTSSLLSSTTNQAEATHSSTLSKKKTLQQPEESSIIDGSNSIALADNEAVACQTSPSLDCSIDNQSESSPDPAIARGGVSFEPLAALARQVYQLNNTIPEEASGGSSSGGGGSQSQQQLNGDNKQRHTNGTSNPNALKSFGDLFDDDDLD